MRRALWLTAALAAASAPALAQETLLPSTAWGFAPIIAGWHFSAPLRQTGGSIQDVAQVAVPFRVSAMFGGRWRFDVTGAYAAGAIHLAKSDSGAGGNGSGSGSGDNVRLLAGPTDVKLRVSGPLAGDALVLTAGVNIPTGTTKLNSDQTSVIQAIGAPALHMPVASYGTGTGATLGVVSATQRGDWALAFGASVEQRTEYTPIALAISGGVSETRVTPGMALHLSVGVDRLLGDGRLSLLLIGDGFSKDKVDVASGGTTAGSSSYTLGPQVTLLTRIDFGASRWRESGTNLGVRYRSAFSDATGVKVSGSDGTYVEWSIGGVRGSPDGKGFVLGADARWHSGLTFTDQLVGAAATVGGVTIGVELPMGGAFFRLALHPQYGTFDTGTAHFTGTGATLSFSFAARREAR